MAVYSTSTGCEQQIEKVVNLRREELLGIGGVAHPGSVTAGEGQRGREKRWVACAKILRMLVHRTRCSVPRVPTSAGAVRFLDGPVANTLPQRPALLSARNDG